MKILLVLDQFDGATNGNTNSARRLTDKTNEATKIQPFAEYPCKFPGKDWGDTRKMLPELPATVL